MAMPCLSFNMQNFTHDFLDNFHFYPHLDSTMDKAMELIEIKGSSGTFAVLTSKQRKGVGRSENLWYSPPGGFYLTLAIYGFSLASNFTLFLGTVLHKVLKSICSDVTSSDLFLKWPNDIYLEDRKLAGMIVRNLTGKKYCLCGIGVNTNTRSFPESLKSSATSLNLAGCKSIDSIELLINILDQLSCELPDYLENGTFSKKYYDKYDFLNDKIITIETEFSRITGKYKGLTQEGALLLQLANGSIQPLYAGSIQIIK